MDPHPQFQGAQQGTRPWTLDLPKYLYVLAVVSCKQAAMAAVRVKLCLLLHRCSGIALLTAYSIDRAAPDQKHACAGQQGRGAGHAAQHPDRAQEDLQPPCALHAQCSVSSCPARRAHGTVRLAKQHRIQAFAETVISTALAGGHHNMHCGLHLQWDMHAEMRNGFCNFDEWLRDLTYC